MLNCREVTQLCSQELERHLGMAERLRLQTHLVMCSGCTHFRKQMQTLRHAMRAYADGKAVGESVSPPDHE